MYVLIHIKMLGLATTSTLFLRPHANQGLTVILEQYIPSQYICLQSLISLCQQHSVRIKI